MATLLGGLFFVLSGAGNDAEIGFVIETVSYKEVRLMMNRFSESGKPVPVSLVFLTANRSDGTGGVWIKADYAVKRSNLRRTSAYRTSEASSTPTKNALLKDPNNWKNQTTNIVLFAKDELTGKLVNTGQIIKVHNRLIFFINGKKVE